MAAEGDVSFQPGPIFEGVCYAIIPSDDLPESEEQKLSQDLSENGASFVPLNKLTQRVNDYSELTHIVSASIDFPDYEDAFLHMVHVVKPSWVSMSIMKGKATNPRQFSPDPCLFMSEVNMTCADIPPGDKEAIQGGLLAMGGQYSAHLTKLVTHIVALTVDNDMCQAAIKKNLRCKIVLPHWFDDCLKLQRRIDERPYLLPDPEIFRRPQKHMNHNVKNYADIQDAIDPSPSGTPTRHQSTTRNRESVFKGKKVLLSNDLGIAHHMRDSIADLIVGLGGIVTDNINDASVVICKYREGSDFFTAFRMGKEIGNLGWLYYLITHNTWTSPTRRLLHYPIPRYPIKGFSKESVKISISCYTGEARLYLENLVNATGATFTKTMKPENTHLITAHLASEKCEAAKEWNVNVVNHLWLEESYARCKMQTLTNQRYITFPSRTNLGEVVGQTPIDREQLQDLYGYQPVEDTPGETMEDVVQSDDKQPHVKTMTSTGRGGRPSVAVGPTKPNRKAAAGLTTTRDDNGALRTPVNSRVASGKENETPVRTVGRAAKQKAQEALEEAKKDIEEYMKESKRVGGVIHGRPRTSHEHGSAAKEARGKKRATPDQDENEDGDEETDSPDEAEGGIKAKRARTTSGEPKRPPISERLMVTKYQKWDQKETQKSADKNRLRNLGVHLTENPSECTILCAPRIVRTKKFVSAIAAAPQVVSTEWLDYVLKHNKLPAGGKYPLDDRVEEDRLGLRIAESVGRAARNNGKLLRGWQIFCTEGVTGGYETYKMIIEANGGMCTLYKGRLTMKASKRTLSRETQEDEAITDNQGDDQGDTLYLLSEEQPKPKDRDVWARFKELARGEDMVPKIVRTDWLLAACMRQRVESEGGKYEIKEAMKG